MASSSQARSPRQQFAVVTGGSTGIGYALAAQFANHGFDVLIAAENDEISRAARLLAETGAQITAVEADLAKLQGVEQLYEKIKSLGQPVDAIAINAGVGVSGRFVETSIADNLNLINLNVTSAVYLTHRILPDMLSRRAGRILITSSIAANMPGPFMATYNASKAFLKSFAEAIREELKETGVTVTTLMPGATETDFFRRAGMEDTKLGASPKDSANEVARDGFEALMAGKDHVVAGSFKNKVQATIAHVLPDTVTARIEGKESEPGSAKQ
jgi:uncharacterized protein